jgi:hypothetical protein
MDGSFYAGYEVVCYDLQDDGIYDFCIADDNTDFSRCMEESSILQSYCIKGICYSGNDVETKITLDSGSVGDRKKGNIRIKYYGHCSSYSYSYEFQTKRRAYYIIYPRQYVCSSSSSYINYGLFSSNYAYNFGTSYCDSNQECDYDKDGSKASFGYYGTKIPDSPCKLKNSNGDCDYNSDCLTGSHCSKVTGTDYCCPNGQDWLNGKCTITCNEEYTGNKRCSGNTPEWEYKNKDCSTEWKKQSACSSTQKCESGGCKALTCSDFSGTFGSCSPENSYYRNGNYIYRCEDQIVLGELLCYVKKSQLGDKNFCELSTKAGSRCGYNEFDCDDNDECASGYECIGPSNIVESDPSEYDGCCLLGEEWDSINHKCYSVCNLNSAYWDRSFAKCGYDYSSQADCTDEPANINPNNANFVNGIATTTWIAEWKDDGIGVPEYYFVAKSEDKSIRSNTPELEVEKNYEPQPNIYISPSSLIFNVGG